MVFGLLDLSTAIFLFLPFFRQSSAEAVQAVSLLSLTEIAPYLKVGYFAIVIALITIGILTLALQNWQLPLWVKNKNKISLFLSAVGTLLFIISMQPYGTAFLFIFLIIKISILLKGQ